MRPLIRSSLALLVAAAAVTPPAARGQLLRWNGRGAAEGGSVWAGPRPAAPPRRVIALAPSLTDVILALGMGDRLVGVTRQDHSPEVAHLPRVGGFLDPSAEAVLGLTPDLVLWVTDGGAAAAVERIAQLGARSSRPFATLAIPIISVADVLAAPRVVGEALGDPGAGERLGRALADMVASVRARAAGAAPRRVLFVVGHEPLVVAGPASFPDELLRLCGGVNVVAGARPWPVYPVEKAVADDPDLVVDAAVQEPDDLSRRLAAVPAVRRGAVFRLSSDELIRPGPRMIAGLEELLRALHPEAAR